MRLIIPAVLLFFGMCSAHAFDVLHSFSIAHQAPDADRVQVAGDFSNWEQRPLVRGANGRWYRTFFAAPGEYGYKLVLGHDQWMLDPNNPEARDGNSLLTITLDGWQPPRGSMVEFAYTNQEASAVFIAGNFNNWQAESTPMHSRDGVWTAALPLPPGDHEYKFVVDGNWIHDPGNPLRSSNYTGTENSLVTVFEDSMARSPHTAAIPFGDYTLRPNSITSLSIPLSRSAWELANKFEKLADRPPANFPEGADLDIYIQLPPHFNPRNAWPILLVSGPDGWENRDHLLQCFSSSAGEAGYVAIAADGLGSRWAQLGSALDYLNQHWPASRRWPVVTAGFLGGSTFASDIAAQAGKAGSDVAGLFMGEPDHNQPDQSLKTYRPNALRFRSTPIFLLHASGDDSGGQDRQQAMLQTLKNDGFKRTEGQVYDGATFPIDPGAVYQGLMWIRRQSGLR